MRAPSSLQRRRWLNGSFFSLLFYVFRFYSLLVRSDHSLLRRLALVVQFAYQVVSLVMTWVGLSTLFLCIFLVCELALIEVDSEIRSNCLLALTLIYTFLTMAQVRAAPYLTCCN